MSKGRTIPTTDLGNAERLVELYGSELRHVGAWSRWLAWDGKRWREDDNGGAMRRAVETSRSLVAEALEALNVANAVLAALGGEATPERQTAADAKKVAEERLKWAIKTQGRRPLESMLALAQADERVAITHDTLDADPWLLNVANGTLDLRTGELRPHARRDLLTKLAPVAFDPKAECPTWNASLEVWMGKNAELVGYVRRIFGYALTGITREHALGFFFGGGANGKTTALRTMMDLLGDYATPAPRGLLFRSRGERHPTELACLHGRRFVTCPEIEAGLAFDEALVKDLTGGDIIAARRMREDFWSFAPTHKLFVAGNHKPTVRGDDIGIWRRLRLVPWVVTIPPERRDKLLVDKLRAELPGILTWAVRGCLEWQANGLGDPPAVVEATDAYRAEQDTLGEFFHERLTFTTDGRIARAELTHVYEEWCKDAGYDHPIGPRKIAERLRAAGCVETRVATNSGPRRGWAGVRLASLAEQVTRPVVGSHLASPDPGLSDRARAREETIRKSVATSDYVATTEDDLERDAFTRFS